MKKVYIVWLIYPDGSTRISAIFTSFEEAKKYAEQDYGTGKRAYKCEVECQNLYRTADEI